MYADQAIFLRREVHNWRLAFRQRSPDIRTSPFFA
jgi:hypothetical protein